MSMRGLRGYRVQGVQRNLTRWRGRAHTYAERVITWVEEQSKNQFGEPLGTHRGRPKLQVGSHTKSGVKVESSFRVKVQDHRGCRGGVQDPGGCRGKRFEGLWRYRTMEAAELGCRSLEAGEMKERTRWRQGWGS